MEFRQHNRFHQLRALTAYALLGLAASPGCAGGVDPLEDSAELEEVATTQQPLSSVVRAPSAGGTMVASGELAMGGTERTREFCDGTRHTVLRRVNLRQDTREDALTAQTCEGARVLAAGGAHVLMQTTRRESPGDLVMVPMLGGTPTVIEGPGRGVRDVMTNGVFVYYTRVDPQTQVPSVHRFPVTGGTIQRLATADTSGTFTLVGSDANTLYFVHNPPGQSTSRTRILKAPRDGNTVTLAGTLGAGLRYAGGAVGPTHVFIAETGFSGSRPVANVWRMRKSDRTFDGFVHQAQDRWIGSLVYESSVDRLYWASRHTPPLGQTALRDDRIESRGVPGGVMTALRTDYDNDTFIGNARIFSVSISGVHQLAFQESDPTLKLVHGRP